MTTNPFALDYEDRIWHPRDPGALMGRLARMRIGTAYRAAVTQPIAHLPLTLDPQVAASAEDARAEIVRFDAELSTLLADGAEIAPLASVLLRTESASSSQIEDITTNARALALAELGLTKHGSNASLVVSNVDAMQRAFALAEQVTPAALLDIHEVLMRGQDRARPGTFRDEPVWIGRYGSTPHDATFVPPHHERIAAAIDDLCTFTTRTDLPLIAQVAIAHAQFETIHPFNDGNGRTGRALVHALLKAGGATTRATVPVSAGLLNDTSSYFAALMAYRDGDLNPIVTRFSDATFSAIANGRALAADLNAAYTDWRDALTARADSVAWRILPMLLSQPAVTSKYVQQHTGTSQPAVDRALRQLREAGIVESKNEYGAQRKRDVVWRSDRILAALDAFGERARRSRW